MRGRQFSGQIESEARKELNGYPIGNKGGETEKEMKENTDALMPFDAGPGV